MDGPDVSLRGTEHMHHIEWLCCDGDGAARGRGGEAPVSRAACRRCDRGRRVSDECSGTRDCCAAGASTCRADLAGQRLWGYSMETAEEVREDVRRGVR